jgi:hypothetical protein
MTDEELRRELVHFARRILDLDARGRLLASPADLQTVMGELRRRLFEFEVRFAAELEPEGDSEGVVREAREAEASLRRSLEPPPGQDPGDSAPDASSRNNEDLDLPPEPPEP